MPATCVTTPEFFRCTTRCPSLLCHHDYAIITVSPLLYNEYKRVSLALKIEDACAIQMAALQAQQADFQEMKVMLHQVQASLSSQTRVSLCLNVV